MMIVGVRESRRARARSRCVSLRSLIGLYVRVPKRNTDFIYPLVYAGRAASQHEGWCGGQTV